MSEPIVWVQRPGQAPEQVHAASVPLARRLYDEIVANGYRAIWVMVDQGVQDAPPDPTCYELERKYLS